MSRGKGELAEVPGREAFFNLEVEICGRPRHIAIGARAVRVGR